MSRPAFVAFLSVLTALSSIGCATVTPGDITRPQALAEPRFERLSIVGLVIRDERLAGRSSAVGSAFGTTSFGGTTGTSQAVAVVQSVSFETFDNPVLRQATPSRARRCPPRSPYHP